MVQESIKHFPIPLRKSLKVIAEGDFLERYNSVSYKKERGFTPIPISEPRRSRNKLVWGFTLVELLIVIIIIGILAALALPQFGKTKEHAIGKEAIANLKLIAAAEKIYRMETNVYYPSSGSESSVANINTNLKLSLTEANWDYSITGGASTFTAYAYRNGSGGYLNCAYSINQSQEEPVSNADCP